MNKLLIICGPTATGKTKLGIHLAKKFNGEIVSADSRQVYRGMDVGTGKDIRNFQFSIFNFQLISKFSNFQFGYYEANGVKIWLLDIVNPDYKFNVADYKRCADVVLEDIWQRGKLPILVGGTGFYIKAVVDGIETMGISPDWKLRERLSHCSIASLLAELTKIDPERSRGMNDSDRQNPRRLIRAIEIATWRLEMGSGKKDNEVGSEKEGSHFSSQYPASHFQPLTSIFFVGLKAPNEILYQRIDQRVDERVKDGIEDEIQRLLNKGYGWENSVLGVTIAYREWKDFFEGKASRDAAIQKWKYDEHDYVRRQMTWFKKSKKINWFNVAKEDWQDKVEKLINSWYI